MIDDTQKAKLKILLVSSEVGPFAKSGGLGDVAGSLPRALSKLDVDIRVVMPKYATIPVKHFEGIEYLGEFQVNLSWRTQTAKILRKNDEVPIYMVENDFYFGRGGFYGYSDDNERFAFFCKAALDMMPLIDFYPDVIHCNDWQTGTLPLFLKEIYSKLLFYSKMKTLFTIHNLQYQGNFDMETMELLGIPAYCYENGSVEFYGRVSYMKMGLTYADWVSTVSKTYAQEIQTPEYSYGMDGVLRSVKGRMCGIVNGIDYITNNPETDSRLINTFDSGHLENKKLNKHALQEQLGLTVSDVPVISMITRLADQKGVDILASIFDAMMAEDVQFVMLGTGANDYEYLFKSYAQRYPGRVSANILFDDTLAQRIYAGSDMFLMPSLFEPCGLGQMFSLRYGTVPIVRKTGGLADTIFHYDHETKQGNGFVFESYDGNGLLWGVRQALDVYRMGEEEWSHVVRNAMACNYSWESSAREYKALYQSLVDGSETR